MGHLLTLVGESGDFTSLEEYILGTFFFTVVIIA